MTKQSLLLVTLVFAALVSRIAPHYPNFTAVGALAFYSAWQTKKLWGAMALTVGVMMFSDLIINNLLYPSGQFVWMYPGSIFTYLGFAAYSIFGKLAPNSNKGYAFIVLGSIVFFALSNLGVWINPMSGYPKSGIGLLAAYTAAIPFYAPELLSTLLFTFTAQFAQQRIAQKAKA